MFQIASNVSHSPRSIDIGMLGMFNARERYADEWESLLQQADRRFRFIGAMTPPGSNLALIEACWEGSDGCISLG